MGYHTITFVKGKFGPNYHNRVGKILAKIPGVSGVYFILVDYDFVVLCVSNNREDFMKKLEMMYNSKDIERTNTSVIMKVIRWDPRIFFNKDFDSLE